MRAVKGILFLVVLVAFVTGSPAIGAETVQKEGSREKCPVMGYPVNQELYTDYQGKRVYFCCPDCSQIFEKDPVKYLKEQ